MNWFADKAFIAYRKAALALLNVQAKRALARAGCLSLFDARPADARPPIWADLWFLYRDIRQRRPRTVLEFGSGCSTLIIAQALAENGEGFLHSIDAEPRWGAATRDSVPRALQPYCDVRIGAALPVEVDGTPAWRHEDVPDVAPDYLYLDGPALTADRRIAVDPLDLEARFRPGFRLLVDGRYVNCAYLERHFRHRYRRSRRPILKNTSYDLIGE